MYFFFLCFSVIIFYSESEIMIKKIYKNKALLAFLCSLVLGCIIIVPFIITGKGIFTLWADYNIEQIPYAQMMNYSIKEGSIFWTWYNELGSNFIGTFSYYNLFSPFSIIGYLFPFRWYPYLGGILTILKFAVSGLTSYLFLKRYVKNKNYAVLGSILYSFSGYQLNNMIFHFYDSVALFPLLLFALDNYMYDDKKNIIPLVVCLLSFTDWFMFIGQGIFTFIYFIVKVFMKEYKINLKKFIYLAYEVLLGILITTVVLLPTFLFTMSNPRVNGSWSFLNMFIHEYPTRYIEMFRSLFFPSEIMCIRAFLTPTNYDSVETYLPFVGSVLAISYLFKKPKKWYCVLTFVLGLFMVIPILNSSFVIFMNTYYARWFYMLILIMCILSIKCLEDKIKINSGLIVSLFAFVVMAIIYVLLPIIKHKSFVFDKSYIIIATIFMLVNLFSLFIIFKINNINKRNNIIFICTCIYISFWGMFTIYKYRDEGFKHSDFYDTYINSYKYIKFDDVSRTNSSGSCQFNLGYVLKNPNIKTFNSNLNGTDFEFYSSIGQSREVSTDISLDNKLNDFLSVKYVISCNEELNFDNYELLKENGIYRVYRNSNFREMGLVFNQYITNKELKKEKNKIDIISDKIVLNKNQVKKYGPLFGKDVEIISNKFKYNKNGFESNINVSDDTLVLYTVPFDEGWSATVNNKKVKIEKVDNGFMAIKVNKGNNKVKFNYQTPGLKKGLIISIIALVMYFLTIIYNKNKRSV